MSKKSQKHKQYKTYCNFDFIQMKPFCECESGFGFIQTDTTMTFLINTMSMVFKFDKTTGAYHHQYELNTDHPKEEGSFVCDVFLKNGTILMTRRRIDIDDIFYDLSVYYHNSNRELKIGLETNGYNKDIIKFINKTDYSNPDFENNDIWEQNIYSLNVLSNNIELQCKGKGHEITFDNKSILDIPVGYCIERNEHIAYKYIFLRYLSIE